MRPAGGADPLGLEAALRSMQETLEETADIDREFWQLLEAGQLTEARARLYMASLFRLTAATKDFAAAMEAIALELQRTLPKAH